MKRLLIPFLLLAPLTALAQFDNGDSQVAKPAWTQFKLPNKKVTLSFHNANADAVLNFFSSASGITIVKDPSLTQPLTITSPKAVSLNDAFTILKANLDLRGFDIVKDGNLLEVKPKGGGPGGRATFDLSQLGGRGRNQTILKVYPIQFASASAVAKTLNDVFTTNGQTNNNFGGRFGGRGFFQINGPGGNNNNEQTGPQLQASADDFSNSVIVRATQDIQDQVADLLKSIDKQANEPYQSKVYKLIYASSDDLAPVIQNVLASNPPTGRGGQMANNVDFFQRFQTAARFGNASSAFGNVVSEPHSNSVIVTATPENQALVLSVINELDKPIKYADSTAIIPLNNAKADDVAYIINQAFQSRIANTNSTTLSNYGRTQTTNPTTNTARPGGAAAPIGLNTTGAASANNAMSAEQKSQQQDLAAQLNDPTLDPSQLETSIAVQGFFGQIMRQGQNGANSQNTPTPGRDVNGQLVNIHNLNGNVTVIPDVNSNSIIIVTNPENMEIVREIIGKLDQVPPQVMIETVIAEATLDNTDKFGLEYALNLQRIFGIGGSTATVNQGFGLQSAGAGASPNQGLSVTLNAGQLSAFLNAEQTDNKFKVLDTPRIFTTQNYPAVINVSQQVPYVVSSQVDVNGNYNYTYNFENVGVVLTVTPRISPDGQVTMDVDQTANELQGYTSFNAPIVNQREANTRVTVHDGETVLLGGIIGDTKSNNVSKIPILGDIPIIGNLFRSTSKQDTRTELMVFLTPKVIRNADDMRKLRQQHEQDMSPGNRQDVDNIIKKNSTPPKEGGH